MYLIVKEGASLFVKKGVFLGEKRAFFNCKKGTLHLDGWMEWAVYRTDPSQASAQASTRAPRQMTLHLRVLIMNV